MHDGHHVKATPESIDLYYAEKGERPENREFIRINEKENLAQVFTDCRYKQSDCEAISESLLDALKQQGFLEWAQYIKKKAEGKHVDDAKLL